MGPRAQPRPGELAQNRVPSSPAPLWGVSHVGGDADGGGQRSVERLAVTTPREDTALKHVGEDRRLRP